MAKADLSCVEDSLGCAGNQKTAHRRLTPPAKRPRWSGYVRRGSVGRRFHRSEFFNLVLECQLASLEIHDLEVVDRWMVHRVIDFSFDVAVFPLQLIKMGSKRHDWFSLSWFPRLQPPKARPPQARFCDGTVTVCHHPPTMSNDPW
jgi:hypothetical protein